MSIASSKWHQTSRCLRNELRQILQETEDTQPVWVRLELESIPAIAVVGGVDWQNVFPPWLIKRECESFVVST